MLKLPILFLLFGVSFSQNPCSRREYDDGIVCVCNSTYCDTVAPLQIPDAPNFITYTSSKPGLRFEERTGSFSDAGDSDFVVEINTDETFQSVLGFGGAFTDSAGLNIGLLEEDAQEKLLESYFSENGIEYSLCRVPIGGTDFSSRGYSYDDGDEDTDLHHFKLADDDFDYKIPYILRALNLTSWNLRLFGSAWTAPKWMKTNNEYFGYGFIKDELYQSWADYFVKFLDSYAEQGIEFWGITTGNEPNTANLIFVEINSVGWTPATMGTWILNNLGPALRDSYKDIKIMILDDQRLYLPWYVSQALGDNDTRNYIDGIAFHWYANEVAAPSLLTDTHNLFPEKFILSTEACNVVFLGSEPVVLGSWERGEYYSMDIIQDIQNWAGGWIDWNMVLDLTGGPTYISNFVDAPVIVNASAGEFYKQPMFYHLGHFSKYVPRDSVRVTATPEENNNVLTVAFQRPDNGVTAVFLNLNDENITATVTDKNRGSASIELDARSITTLIYQ